MISFAGPRASCYQKWTQASLLSPLVASDITLHVHLEEGTFASFLEQLHVTKVLYFYPDL